MTLPRRGVAHFLVALVLAAALPWLVGCGGEGGATPVGAAPGAPVTLAGELCPPGTAPASWPAVARVNGESRALVVVPASTAGRLAFAIAAVPAAEVYRIAIPWGDGTTLRVDTTRVAGIVLDARSTAGALLAEHTGGRGDWLAASAPALLTPLAASLAARLATPPADPAAADAAFAASLASLATVVASHAVASDALFAWLQPGGNDLDGDGRADFRVERGSGGLSYHLQPLVDSHMAQSTSPVTTAAFVDDATLRAYQPSRDGLFNYISAGEKNVGLWSRLTYGKATDIFVRLRVLGVDVRDGVLAGIPIEYQLLAASGTAIATGSRTFKRSGLAPGPDEVAASDFLADGPPGGERFCFFDAARDGGEPLPTLGSSDPGPGLLCLVAGSPALEGLASAPVTAPELLHPHTAAALAVASPSLPLAVGQVFAFRFPSSRRHGVLRVTGLDLVNHTLSVDFRINRCPDDPGL